MTKASGGSRYALLIRGINVGTKNSLPMAELRAMLERSGATDVRTYVQSGNAVFATKKSPAAFTKAIEAEIASYMGREVRVTLRTGDEFRALVRANPFEKIATKPAWLCATFFSKAPTKSELAPLAGDFGEERFELSGREIFSWHPNGQGNSKLAVALGKLKVEGAVTTRNWNTVLQLLSMLEQH